MRIFGKGFNFSQDGPGNRLVYHLSGCNMRCIWCSNPDGMDPGAGKVYTVDQIVQECKDSRPLFFAGGGVTFTGGEATLQHDELLAVLKRLKEEDIHTAIETNGTSERLSVLLDYVNYLIMDFKHYNTEILKQYTGVGAEVVKRNFEQNCCYGRQQHIRIPLINGVNADCPQEFASYFSQHDTSCTVFEFLAYHEYGKHKWTSEYKVKDGFVTTKTINTFISTFHEYGLTTINT